MIHSDVEVVETIIDKEIVNQGKHFSGNRNDTFFVADLCTVRPIPNTETVFSGSNCNAGTLTKNGFQIRITGHDLFGFDFTCALIIARG